MVEQKDVGNTIGIVHKVRRYMDTGEPVNDKNQFLCRKRTTNGDLFEHHVICHSVIATNLNRRRYMDTGEPVNDKNLCPVSEANDEWSLFEPVCSLCNSVIATNLLKRRRYMDTGEPVNDKNQFLCRKQTTNDPCLNLYATNLLKRRRYMDTGELVADKTNSSLRHYEQFV